MHVTPARTKLRTIAGPESPTASPRMTKIPVPMTAPMPRAVRSRAPTARRSPLSSLSATTVSTSLVASRAEVAMAPPLSTGVSAQTVGTALLTDDDTSTQPEPGVTTAEGIEQHPRGNPDIEPEAVEKSEDVLER